MFNLGPQQQAMILALVAFWVFSAAVSSLDAPDEHSGAFYRWLYKFLKQLAGDFASIAGKYLPGSATYSAQETQRLVSPGGSVQEKTTTQQVTTP